MTVGQKQRLFSKLLAKLILKAYSLGYEISLGEVWRPDATAEWYAKQGIGIENSLHRIKLAADLNLFWNGHYLRSFESHLQLGEWWEQQHHMCRWGGRFGDANHYSLAHKGVR